MLNFRQIWIALILGALLVGARGVRADDPHVVSLTCREMEIHRAISILQGVSDLRIVISPKVPHKRVSLSLKDLPPEDALKTLVSAAGLTCRKVGNAFLVEPGQTIGRAGSGAGKPSQTGAESEGITSQNSEPAPAPLLGGIVRPDAPVAAGGRTAPLELQQAVAVAPEVLAGLERPVDVDVKNGPLSAVMQQLSRSTGIKVTADPSLSTGLLATVGLHGIALKTALEMVADQTGLQISPRPDGVAFVTPGLSLDAAQARTRHTPSGARKVDQGQLWTAEWANVLTSGISAVDAVTAPRSLRRQTGSADGKPIPFRPRRGDFKDRAPAAPPTPALKHPASAGGGAQPAKKVILCPQCGQPVPLKAGHRCGRCGRVLPAGVARCPRCGGKPEHAMIMPARCPSCGQLLVARAAERTGRS